MKRYRIKTTFFTNVPCEEHWLEEWSDAHRCWVVVLQGRYNGGKEKCEQKLRELIAGDNGCLGWPEDWPRYKQACFGSWDSACDMLIGPCACGAGHAPGEFHLEGNQLFRYGKPVPSKPRGITPGIMIDGQRVEVPGCVWIMGFALAGVEWAVKQMAEDPKIELQVKAWEAGRRLAALQTEIARRRQELEHLERQQFDANLTYAAAEVGTWPEWKQNVLGTMGQPTGPARQPVSTDDGY